MIAMKRVIVAVLAFFPMICFAQTSTKGIQYTTRAVIPCDANTSCMWVDTATAQVQFYDGTTAKTIPSVVATTKGDIAVWNGTTWVKLAAGADGRVLTAASGQASGLEWAVVSASTGNWSFSGDTADLTGAGTMTLGGANATAISLTENTTISGSNTFTTGTGLMTCNASAIAIGTDNIDIGDATHRVDLFSKSITAGATTMTLTTTVASGSAREGFILNDTNKNASDEPILSIQDNGVTTIAFGKGASGNIIQPNGIPLNLYSNSGNGQISIQDSLIWQCVGSTCIDTASGSFASETDSAHTLGKASKRWSYGLIGDVAGDMPTCDATTRGSILTVFATAGNSDTVQVCMKAAADTYAFYTIFTAP